MDPKALLIENYALVNSAIRRTCARYRIRAPDAEDLTSELWLYVLRNDARVLRRFQGRCSLATYLYRVLDRATSKWIQKRKARMRIEVVAGDTYIRYESHAGDPAVLVSAVNDLRRDQITAVQRAIRRLPAHDLSVLKARLAGSTFSEIAKARGLSRKTVQNTVYRALALLRRLSEPEYRSGRAPAAR